MRESDRPREVVRNDVDINSADGEVDVSIRLAAEGDVPFFLWDDVKVLDRLREVVRQSMLTGSRAAEAPTESVPFVSSVDPATRSLLDGCRERLAPALHELPPS